MVYTAITSHFTLFNKFYWLLFLAIEGLGAYNLSLSELGKMVLANEVLCQHVVTTLLEVLVWPDSPTSARASYLLELVLPIISSNENLLSDQVMFLESTMYTVVS